jgi:hypothetical protein
LSKLRERMMQNQRFLRMKPTVQARILRLNADWKGPGYLIRGMFFKPVSWRRVKKHFARSEESPPYSCFRTPDGKVWWVPYDGFVDGPIARLKGWIK